MLWPCLFIPGLGTFSKSEMGTETAARVLGTNRAEQAHLQDKVTKEQRSQSAEGKDTVVSPEENQK